MIPNLKPIGYVWALPTTLASLILFFLPMWLLGQLVPLKWDDGAWEWTIVEKSWFRKKYEGWGGTTLGFIIFLAPECRFVQRIHIHERRHVWQNMILGPLFLPLYVLGYVFGIFYAQFAGRIAPAGIPDAYWFNPFEMDARNHTGERVL